MVQMLDAYGEGPLNESISVEFHMLQICFRCKIATTYQLAHAQYIKEAAREVLTMLILEPAQ